MHGKRGKYLGDSRNSQQVKIITGTFFKHVGI